MATTDVPGANPVNNDELAMGCWAEHEDGSLILVEGIESPNSIVYAMFDMSQNPPVEYRDAMPQKGFEQQFSWDAADDNSVKWTWHDKTPFPWDRVMRDFAPGEKQTSALSTLSVAQKVAQSLQLHAQALRPTQGTQSTAHGIMTRLRKAAAAFKE